MENNNRRPGAIIIFGVVVTRLKSRKLYKNTLAVSRLENYKNNNGNNNLKPVLRCYEILLPVAIDICACVCDNIVDVGVFLFRRARTHDTLSLHRIDDDRS